MTRHFLSILFAAAALAAEPAANLTPAQRDIQTAQAAAQRDTRRAQPLAELAMAYVGRARETSDPRFLEEADRAIEQALRLEKDSIDAQRARLAVLNARNRYEEAVGLGRKLNQRMPDDVQIYGLLADAYLALGQYAKAEREAQWMIDMRRGNLGGMVRGALLREVYGDPAGALEWLHSALRLTGIAQNEQRAWILCQIARVEIGDAKYDIAAAVLDRADKLFPNYAPALDQRVELELAREQFTAAAQASERLLAVWPHPRARYLLARSLHGAGEAARAREVFATFEREALAWQDQPANVNRELILYYAEFAGRAEDAVRLARKEMARRQDIWTLQAAAVALKNSGDLADAKAAMSSAMKAGTRDQRLLRLAAKL